MNLLDKLEERVAPGLMALVRRAGEVAGDRGESLYLVGGAVRDLLLDRVNIDLDLVLEGDAVELATQLRKEWGGRVITHKQFGTAKLIWEHFTIDFITARAESYEKPGALPTVRRGELQDDLYRRDFTINAMALCLTPSRYGELIDLHGGKQDLDIGIIRVLHDRSFIDDATRLFRALRYEHRLGFALEQKTEELARRDAVYLDSISSDRLYHELDLALAENKPEDILKRAEELKILCKVHSGLRGNGWLAEKYHSARNYFAPKKPPMSVYLSLMVWHLEQWENEKLILRLHLPARLARVVRDTLRLKAKSDEFKPGLKNSQVYEILNHFLPLSIQANIIALGPGIETDCMELFLDKLISTRPEVDGARLKELGAAQGRRLGAIMRALLVAKLDGEITNRVEEEKLALRLIGVVKAE